MKKQIIPLIKSTTAPTSSENIAAGYPLGQNWLSGGKEYIHISDGDWVEYARFGALGTAPASATAAGNVGTVIYTADYIYVCTATNTWKRTALTTW